jgi:hypothetical protein
LVFALTEAVPEVIAVPSDVEAVVTRLSVFALITVASEVEAVKIVEFVFEFTADVIPAVAELVFALITAASDVLAVETVVPTVVTSDCVASEPVSRPAPVKVRVALDHTSVANVPNVVKLRDV